MSKKNILTGEGMKQFGQAMEQLKLSLEGILSVADNMIPEKVFTSSFNEYYTELFYDIGIENSIQINVSFSGEFQNLEESHRIKTYLLIQSVFSFLINYTKPTQIDLQFICSGKSITIHISDNGEKYNLPILTYPGIKESENIKELTESMNGIFTILDSQKEGNKLRITFHG